MGDFIAGARAATIMGEMNQGDKSLQADISKLIFIAKSVAEEFGEFIRDIFISPATIIQTPLNQISDIEIFVSVDYSVDMEPKEFSIEEFVKYYVKEEYPILKDFTVSVNHQSPKVGNYLSLYTSDKDKRIKDIIFTDKELLMFDKLLSDQKIMVEIPLTWDDYRCKCMLLHIGDSSDLFTYVTGLEDSEKMYGINLKEAVHKDEYTVAPIVGFDKLPYELPYRFLTRSDLNLQRLEALLNPETE